MTPVEFIYLKSVGVYNKPQMFVVKKLVDWMSLAYQETPRWVVSLVITRMIDTETRHFSFESPRRGQLPTLVARCPAPKSNICQCNFFVKHSRSMTQGRNRVRYLLAVGVIMGTGHSHSFVIELAKRYEIVVWLYLLWVLSKVLKHAFQI